MTRLNPLAVLAFCAIAFAHSFSLHAQEVLEQVEVARTAVSSLAPVGEREQLRADVEYLASEELRGRGVGDETIDQAASYIEERMSEIGLGLTSPNESRLQPFDVVLGARPAAAANNYLTIQPTDAASEPISVSLGTGFTPMAVGSSSGKVSGPLVFVGYGITAPKLNYDDYESIDASGAIAIILRKEPQLNDPNSRFQGTRNSPHAFFLSKIKNAIKHGASAVVLINDPESVLKAVQNVRSKILRENQRREKVELQLVNLPEEAANSRVKLTESLDRIGSSVKALEQELEQASRGLLGVSEAGRRSGNRPSIPVVSVARDVANAWLGQFGESSLEAIEQEIDATGSPRSMPLSGAKATLTMELEPLKTETSNVIGVLPGRGPLAEQTIVIGAHYDHVGMGGDGSLAPGTIAVHNGADDNASGTAAMLGSAAQIKSRLANKTSRRRVVFIAFSAEERGLLGSKHYVGNPRFPIESTVAMVNLDMVGRLRNNELTVYGTGSSNMLDRLVEDQNGEQAEPFRLFKVPTGYGPSDHQSFYEAGVPVLFFFTGLHNDYHRPSDDFDKIDFGNLTRITDIVSDVGYELAIRSKRPVYAETDKRVKIRRQLTAYLGVYPTDQGEHVIIGNVVADGPAEESGIRAGDRLEKLGDQRIRIASEVVDWVRAHSPGDRAIAVIRRDGQELRLTVQLGKRPS